jgi:hypothetical protein
MDEKRIAPIRDEQRGESGSDLRRRNHFGTPGVFDISEFPENPR